MSLDHILAQLCSCSQLHTLGLKGFKLQPLLDTPACTMAGLKQLRNLRMSGCTAAARSHTYPWGFDHCKPDLAALPGLTKL